MKKIANYCVKKIIELNQVNNKCITIGSTWPQGLYGFSSFVVRIKSLGYSKAVPRNLRQVSQIVSCYSRLMTKRAYLC
jgi:hypothetical protein